MSMIRVNLDQCEKEGICVETCPLGILEMDPESGPQIVPGKGKFCIACGHCVAVCPHGALDHVRNPLDQQEELPSFPVLDPEKAFAFLRSRRSIRCYKDEPVPREKLLQLLEIARYAPSGHNSQGLSYLVVEGREHLDGVRKEVLNWMQEVIRSSPATARMLYMDEIVKIHEAGGDFILRGAPQLIVAMGLKNSRFAPVSTSLALEYVELYATSLGLGTCWGGYVQVCAQQYPPLSTFLRIPPDRMLTGAMVVGVPKHTYHRIPGRNPLEVSWLGENG